MVLQIAEDASRNPESDSFQYICMIIESLTKMGRLESAVDSIEQRLPVELFRVVERVNTEIQQRHPHVLKVDWKTSNNMLNLPSPNDIRAVVLNDLLETLYAKFEAIAESHRVFHDVASRISKREGVLDAASLTRGFKELWNLYQSEVRSLLHDYLSAEGDAAQRYGQGLSGEGNIFRYQRDKTKVYQRFVCLRKWLMLALEMHI